MFRITAEFDVNWVCHIELINVLHVGYVTKFIDRKKSVFKQNIPRVKCENTHKPTKILKYGVNRLS